MRSVARVAGILRAFTTREPRRALTEIAARAKLDLGTTRRILKALIGEGLVAYDSRTRKYGLDLGLLELAGAVVEGDDLRDRAQEAVEGIARETGYTTFFGVIRDDEALCLARADANAVILLRWWTLGGRMPLNCGAAPKALLAHSPASRIDAVLTGELAALTPHSQTDRGILRKELARIRRQGFALAVDDVVPGVAGLAVPATDARGNLVGALSIAGLTRQLSPATRKELVGTLRRHAAALGARTHTTVTQ
jgi:DNA-binding IclR family transcriptional regulator